MMIHCQKTLLTSDYITVAVSGGRDSMAALDYLRRGPWQITAAIYDHGTGLHSAAEPVVRKYCEQHGIPLLVGGPAAQDLVALRDLSPEESWRQQRYQWLDSLDGVVVLAHHLDDAIETWLWSCLHGSPKHMPWTRAQCVRPFLLTDREGFTEWCSKNSVPYIDDPANLDGKYQRVRVREQLVPAALAINPGLKSLIRKRLKEKLTTSAVEPII